MSDRNTTTTSTEPGLNHRSPGRPRKLESDAILDSALELFWKNGFNKTTTRELETHLGLNQSSIYSQFGSKQKLLQQALDHYENLTTEQLLWPLQQGTDGLEDIYLFFKNLQQWVTHDGRKGCMLINMMAEDAAANDVITQRTRKYRRVVKKSLKRCLELASEQGQLSDPETTHKAELLMALTLGFNISVRGGATKREQNSILRAVTVQLNEWRETLN